MLSALDIVVQQLDSPHWLSNRDDNDDNEPTKQQLCSGETRVIVICSSLFLLLVLAEGPMSWLIKNSSEVAKKMDTRPSTCPAICSSGTTSTPAPEAISQDDAIVR